MNKLVRGLIAGWGAKKLGGGCFGTILVFIILYWLLGKTCNAPVQTAPQRNSSIQVPVQKSHQISFVDKIRAIK
ncbi:MAG: hypothetical protein ABIN25_12880 [Ginsengibacter sp.]